MPPRKVSDKQLKQLVIEGNGVSEIARRLGVSKSTVSRRLKDLNIAITRSVTIREAPKIVEGEINAFEQLQAINRDANDMLQALMGLIRGDVEALAHIQGCTPSPKDPRELALRCMSEIRSQLDMQLKLMQALYDMKAVAEFQQEVVAAIGEAAPDVRERIIHNLQKKRAIRSSLDWPGPDRSGGD